MCHHPCHQAVVHYTDFDYRRHPYSCYAVFLTTLIQWSIVCDVLRLWLCYSLSTAYYPRNWLFIFVPYAAWVIFINRAVKFIGHWVRYPEDLLYLPLLPLIGYAHGFIKLKALSTLKEVRPSHKIGTRHLADDAPADDLGQ